MEFTSTNTGTYFMGDDPDNGETDPPPPGDPPPDPPPPEPDEGDD